MHSHPDSLKSGIPISPEETLPVFQQSWWLDAVCGADRWKKEILLESDTALPLVWPVSPKRIGPFRYWRLPLFTQKMDWYFQPEHPYRDMQLFQKNRRVLLFRMGLPDTPDNQKLLTSWGFQCQTAHSYVAAPLPAEQAWQRIRPTARARIRKAASMLDVRYLDHAAPLYQLVTRSHRRHGIGMGFDAATCQRIVTAVLEKKRGFVCSAEDAQGRLHAAALFVWDRQTMYYLLAGMDENIPQIGAARLLMWHGMQHAFSRQLHFDFHGGMSPDIGAVYASMGARPVPYLRATRYASPLLRTLVTTAKRLYAPNDRLFH